MLEMQFSLYFMQSQGYEVEIVELYQDNKSTEPLMQNGGFSSGKKKKHIKTKFFFIKDRVDGKESCTDRPRRYVGWLVDQAAAGKSF
jgi:hypothetical protein